MDGMADTTAGEAFTDGDLSVLCEGSFALSTGLVAIEGVEVPLVALLSFEDDLGFFKKIKSFIFF